MCTTGGIKGCQQKKTKNGTRVQQLRVRVAVGSSAELEVPIKPRATSTKTILRVEL